MTDHGPPRTRLEWEAAQEELTNRMTRVELSTRGSAPGIQQWANSLTEDERKARNRRARAIRKARNQKRREKRRARR